MKGINSPQSPKVIAVVALIAIQVGIGIILKIAQTNGQYAFSTSASISISEFLKMLMSVAFFYQECRKRPKDTFLTPDRSPKSEDEDFEKDPHPAKLSAPNHLKLSAFWKYCVNEVPLPAVYGFAQLALLYALINNTVFVAYKLADPGTISITKSGVTFITALVMIYTLRENITRFQWLAIVLQCCGLVTTQYHPETTAAYPFTTYLVLIFQVFLSAISGVYNQALLKSYKASLHADNMILYAAGALVNTFIHVVMKILREDEPWFFQGYNSIGAVLVILSNVFIGLAITAVYKYADAVIKCLATAVATGILLFLSAILFDSPTGPFIIPGTIVVLTASWFYVKAGSSQLRNTIELTSNASKFKSKARCTTVLIFTTILSIFIIAFIDMYFAPLPDMVQQLHANFQKYNLSLPHIQEPEEPSTVLESPFKNTMAYIRWNSYHPERIPLLSKYTPYYHAVHYSLPLASSEPFHNLTHDFFTDIDTHYAKLALTMQYLLDVPPSSPEAQITGLHYFHFDAWIDPLDYAGENLLNMHIPELTDFHDGDNGPALLCMTDASQAPYWWRFNAGTMAQTHSLAATQTLSALNPTLPARYVFNPAEFCVGWSDIYYIPKRFFADWIFLSSVFEKEQVFHEIAVPTMMRIIDQSRRDVPTRSVWTRFGDCWGSCCREHPDLQDLLFHRCGHKLDYVGEDQSVVQAHYARLDANSELLGKEVGVAA